MKSLMDNRTPPTICKIVKNQKSLNPDQLARKTEEVDIPLMDQILTLK